MPAAMPHEATYTPAWLWRPHPSSAQPAPPLRVSASPSAVKGRVHWTLTSLTPMGRGVYKRLAKNIEILRQSS